MHSITGRRCSTSGLKLGYLIFLLIAAVPARASGPGWSSSASNYAAANQGQLKNIATAAATNLDSYLPGGAGDAIHTMITSWANPTSQTNNYAAVTLGQLKAVAALFYDRLIAVGYTNQYPWTGSTNAPKDSAMANLGQVKNLFSFNLTATDAAHDADGNGIPDWWEKYYFGRTGVNPNSIEDGGALTNKQQFDLGLNPTINEAATSGSGSSSTNQIKYVYNSLGRLVSTSGGTSGKNSTYVYDSEGNVVGIR